MGGIELSVKVKLEDGSMEKFHKAYIIESLETVGLDHKSAKKIANEVEKHKGMTEHEIKVKIFQKLDMIDKEMANRYMETKKVHVKSEALQVMGNVLLPEFLMSYQELRSGEQIDVIHGDKNVVLRAYEMKDIHNHQDHNVIFMSDRDMGQIGINGNNQVGICKHH